jgi:nucleoside-diphosphate-sugar epimerase
MRRHYDTSKLREELGWQPRDAENAMRDMLALEQKH